MNKIRHDLSARKLGLIIAVFLVISLLAGIVCVFFGSAALGVGEVFSILLPGGGPAEEIPFNIVIYQRVPRVLLALMAGGGLAVAGAVFQALLRNPLATPHTLGVSAGGALGAAVAILFDLTFPSFGAFGMVQICGLAGSLGVMIIIYLLARHKERFSTLKLLLAGVTMALVASAMIMFVRYMADPHKLVRLDRWLMGGLQVNSYRTLAAVLPLYLPAVVLLFSQLSNLNQLAFGEELAAGRGLNVPAVQISAFVGGSLLTASIVSVAGPIGFVGLIIPHTIRLILGPDHRVLLFGSFFAGAAFLAIADTFARTVLAPTELPVGVLTAMLGGPFFLVLLIRKRDW
ncbi:MAG: iron ABC transporter permease [Planctomycetes bacterium]|nr:iron ABC transporter permease [Planctomycetota bacterium]